MKRMMYVLLLLMPLLGMWTSCQPDSSESESSEGGKRIEVADTPEAMIRALGLQIASNPKDYSLFERRSQVYFELDSLPQAESDIEQAIALYPNGPDLHYWRGFLAYVQDDTTLARTELQTAAGLGTQNPEVFYQLGQIFFLQKKYDQALEEYERAAKFGGNDPTYVFAQGFLEESRRQHSEAVRLYVDALAVDSTFDKALLRLHDVYLTQYENETEAMKYNAQLLRNQPSHPLGQYNQGSLALRKALALLNQSDLPIFQDLVNEAVVAFTITVNRDPNFVQAWYNRGYCYWLGEGREEQALQDFQQAISLDPTHAQAHYMIGSIFEKNGDLRTALIHYEQAAKYRPESRDFQRAKEEVGAALK